MLSNTADICGIIDFVFPNILSLLLSLMPAEHGRSSNRRRFQHALPGSGIILLAMTLDNIGELVIFT